MQLQETERDSNVPSQTTMSEQWYQTFFNGLAVDFWDGATHDEWTEGEVVFLAKIFEKPGAKLLDVLCGAGRHIPGLTTLGYQLTGVDISPKMLTRAKQRSEAFPDFQGEFYQLDALAGLTPVLGHTPVFDGAYCLGNSFGYTGGNHTQRFLADLVSLLKPSAKLVLNSAMLAETLLPNWETRMDMVAGGVYAMIENLEYDPIKSRLLTRFEFESDDDEGQTTRESLMACHYIFTSGEVIRWLDALGCDCLGIYSNTNQKPYLVGDDQWYGVFQKR